jgi:hypothetical protein
MTQGQFTHAVMEEIFIPGLVCLPRAFLSICVEAKWAQLGPLADPRAFAENSVPSLPRAMDPLLGTFASASGAGEEWIAIHEASHAIVAVKAGIMVRGIRFYGDGLRGETGIEELAWCESTDEELLQRLVFRQPLIDRLESRLQPVSFDASTLD